MIRLSPRRGQKIRRSHCRVRGPFVARKILVGRRCATEKRPRGKLLFGAAATLGGRLPSSDQKLSWLHADSTFSIVESNAEVDAHYFQLPDFDGACSRVLTGCVA